MNRNYIAFNEATIQPGKSETIVAPGANFIRCLNSDGRRFSLSLDGEAAVPCWGGWYFRIGAGETVRHLTVSLSADETEPLKVEFMHGLGSFDDKQLQLVNEYAAASEIRIAVPQTAEGVKIETEGDTYIVQKLFDSDPAAQEIILTVNRFDVIGFLLNGDDSVIYRIFSGNPNAGGVLLGQLITVANSDTTSMERIEFRLKYAGEVWIEAIDNTGDGWVIALEAARLKL